MGKSALDREGYNYEFIVDRKYPLLSLLEEVKQAEKKLDYVDYKGTDRHKDAVERNRVHLKGRIQIIYWVMEAMVENSPLLIENGGYMGSYFALKESYPKAMHALNKRISLKENEVEAIKATLRYLGTFLSETT